MLPQYVYLMFVCVTFKCMPVPLSIHATHVTFVVKKTLWLQRSPLPGARCRLRSRSPASPRLDALVGTPIRPHRPAGRLGRPAGQADRRVGRRAGGDDRPGGRGRRVLRAGEEGGEARTGGGTDEPRLHHVRDVCPHGLRSTVASQRTCVPTWLLWLHNIRVSSEASFYCGFTALIEHGFSMSVVCNIHSWQCFYITHFAET